MNGLRAAATFLTRVPLHPRDERAAGDDFVMSAAVPWFPVVGLVVGAFQAALYLGGAELVPPITAAVIAMAGAALVTGAFHHDGLADMADAFGGGWTVEQRLTILKDSRLGTYGVTALALVLLLEVSTVSALDGRDAATAILTAHALSRAVPGILMLTVRPAASSGLGVDYIADLSRPAVLVSSALAAAATVAVWGLAGLVPVAASLVAGACVAWLAVRKIGGISGDVLGAIQQLAKASILVAAVALL